MTVAAMTIVRDRTRRTADRDPDRSDRDRVRPRDRRLPLAPPARLTLERFEHIGAAASVSDDGWGHTRRWWMLTT